MGRRDALVKGRPCYRESRYRESRVYLLQSHLIDLLKWISDSLFTSLAQYCPSTYCRSLSTGRLYDASTEPVLARNARLYCRTTDLVLLRSWSQPFAITGLIANYLYWSTVLSQYYAGGKLRRNTEISTWVLLTL